MDNPTVLPIGDSEDLRSGNTRDDLPDGLLALPPDYDVDVRAHLEKVLHLLRSLVTPDDREDLLRQLREALVHGS